MARLSFVGPFSAVTLSLCFAAASGCGGEEESSGPSLDSLPEALAEAACEAVSTCLGDGLSVLLSGEDCETNSATNLTDLVDSIRPSVEAGRVDYVGAKLEGCLDAIRSAGCGFTDTLDDSPCEAALDGTVKLGDPCDFNLECAGQAYCKSTGTCPGACTEREKIGGPCRADSDCAADLSCNDAGGTCYRPSEENARCGGGVAAECAFGLLCLNADEEQQRAGTCKKISDVLVATVGVACNPVQGPFCAPGLHCRIESVTDVISATCVARATAGSPCGAAFPDMCPADQYCSVTENQLDGTCMNRPTAGNPCAGGPFGDEANICAPNTRCDDGVCRSRQKVGASCATNDACMSEYCLDGKCALDGSCG